MHLAEFSQAAVMDAAEQPLALREFPMPGRIDPNAALVRIDCCTICRSDLHTWLGNRPGPTPSILGHEVVGTLVALGKNRTHDASDAPLALGDRVTWALHQACGVCRNCAELHLPMKCRSLHKFGHGRCDESPHLLGGFAQHAVVGAGTAILRVPDNLPDTVAAPANCAAATAVAACEAIDLRPGESVLIQGAGALGVYAAAYAARIGCRQIVVSDVNVDRLTAIKRFGATHTINASGLGSAEFAELVNEQTDGGADAAIEAAGAPNAVVGGLTSLRVGGSYAECGCVFPNATAEIDLSLVLRNLLTIRGVHNYDVRHLRVALEFLSATVTQHPWEELVGSQYPLTQINEALHEAHTGTAQRVAVVPSYVSRGS